MEDRIEGAVRRAHALTFKRRPRLGLGLSALSSVRAVAARRTATQTVRWISPRGTLDVMDDFDLWVPLKMGYFKKLGINAKLIAGPISDALACTKFVAQNQADMGYPSPGVLTASIDSGIPVKSIWDMISGQVFDFALPTSSTIKIAEAARREEDRARQRRLEHDRRPDPRRAGHRPEVRHVRERGNQWAQSVESGQADAGLAWEGLRAQWAGQGLKLKYLIGTDFSKQPSNVYSVRGADLDDAAKRDLYTRFLQGIIMGLEFAKANPRAAAQITYSSLPDLQKSLKPQLAPRLVARARARVRHEPPQGPGLGLQRREGLVELPEDRPRPRPDEEAPRDEGRDHERAAGGREQEGRRRRARKDAKALQARQGLRADEGPGRLHDVVDRRGASPFSGAPRNPSR